MSSGRIVLDLHVKVRPGRLAAFTSFLQRALPYYEEPGDICIRLLQDRSEPANWIERVEYADASAYDRDQRRVAEDQRMKSLLAEWRE